MVTSDCTENTLIEQPAIELFAALGWETARCFNEWVVTRSRLGRQDPSEVVLVGRLRAALARLNPELAPEAIEAAVEALCQDRSAMSAAHANREVYRLLKDGVK